MSAIRNWAAQWVASVLALFIITKVVPGITTTSVVSLISVVVAMGFANSFIRPIIMFFAWPINCLTFGLFGFALNIIFFGVLGKVIPGFQVSSSFSAIIGAVLMGALSGLFSFILKETVKKR